MKLHSVAVILQTRNMPKMKTHGHRKKSDFTSDMQLYGLANADWYTDADIKELAELEQKLI